MADVEYPILSISNEEMDETVKREQEKTGMRLLGYPMFRSPDGRLYPLPGDDIVIHNDHFTISR